jgi:hypothetical protein
VNVCNLPVSASDVRLRYPAGTEEILLLEALAYDTTLALALITCLASRCDGERGETGTKDGWGALCVTDLDALLLCIRQMVLGDLIRTDVICPVASCRTRFDVAFRISEYLAHHRPTPARGAEPSEEVGWFRLRHTSVSFRLPNGADLVAVARQPQPERALIRRCVRPTTLPARLLHRVERAMEALAPALSHDLQGDCPDCGTRATIYFDVQQFTLSELRQHAAFIYEDVHLLATQYHWPEAEILALPRNRRARYVELARQEQAERNPA